MNDHIQNMVHEFESGRMTRRQLVGKLGALFALAGGAGRVINAQDNPNTAGNSSTFAASELNHIALRVTDVPRSRDFYMKHLGLKLSREGSNNAFLTCGKNFVALFQGNEPAMDHYCYSVKNYEADQAEDKLRSAGLKDIRRTSGRVYFSDPDKLTVQLAGEDHSPL